jgi:hypothetical protein
MHAAGIQPEFNGAVERKLNLLSQATEITELF